MNIVYGLDNIDQVDNLASVLTKYLNNYKDDWYICADNFSQSDFYEDLLKHNVKIVDVTEHHDDKSIVEAIKLGADFVYSALRIPHVCLSQVIFDPVNIDNLSKVNGKKLGGIAWFEKYPPQNYLELSISMASGNNVIRRYNGTPSSFRKDASHMMDVKHVVSYLEKTI